jgi:hypothetical protein
MLRRIACENILITCSASCFEVWNVIWKMRFKFVLCRDCLKWFIFVIMLDHLIVSFSNSSSFIFDEWRMLILDYRVTYVCSRFVERRLWCDVKLDEASHQTWRKRLIKLDETSHQIWWKRLIKFDERDVISSNLTKASSHQTWDRHLIKLFEKKDNFSIFWWAIRFHATTRDKENLVLQKITFILREDRWAFLMKVDADIIQLFLKEELQVKSEQLKDDCCRQDNSSS